MATQMASRRNRVVEFAIQHGIHAFIFLSFIFAETLTVLIDALIGFLRSPIPWTGVVSQPEVTLLFAITILTVEYWWEVFESAQFYGSTLVYFGIGVAESGTFYGIAYLLRDFFRPRVENDGLQLNRVFISFFVLILLFLLADIVKLIAYRKDAPTKEKLVKGIWPWQVLRLCGVGSCIYGFLGHQPKIAADILLALVVIFTVSVCVKHLK